MSGGTWKLSPERRRKLNADNKRRHDERRAAGICINNASHGPAFKGGRCETCWNIKKAGEAARVRRPIDVPEWHGYPWRAKVHREASYLIRSIRKVAARMVDEEIARRQAAFDERWERAGEDAA